MKTIIIFGSARSHGNTRKIVDELISDTLSFTFLDLADYTIHPFDYDHINQGDDFLPLIREIVEKYDCLLFATPVYWYSMSVPLKIFFDRITDCLTIDKATGRKLRGKKLALLSCSNADDCPDYFHRPFQDSADYLGMEYLGHTHTWLSEGAPISPIVKTRLKELVGHLSR